MKKISRLFVCIIISLPVTLQAQWTQTNGPNNGGINSIIISGEKIFAGTEEGVFLSTNEGATWNAVNNGISVSYVFALALYDSNLFAGTWGGGVYLSTNSGISWTQVNNGLSNPEIRSLTPAQGPGGETDLYAGTLEAGIFLSTDNGGNWTQINNGLTNLNIQSLATVGLNVFAGTYGGGVFISTNQGSSWTPVNNGLSSLNTLALAASGNNLFAGSGTSIYVTSDNGADWDSLYTEVNNFTITSIVFSPDENSIFAGTSGEEILVSHDYGSNWDVRNTPLYNGNIESLAILPDQSGGEKILAGSIASGIILSDDDGINWSGIGIPRTEVNCFTSDGQNLLAGTKYSGIYLSTDGGANWKDADKGIWGGSIMDVAFYDSMLFAATAAGGVYRSNDLGSNWERINNGLLSPSAYSFSVIENKLLVGTSMGLFYSTDNGDNWNAIQPFLYKVVASFAVNNSDIFVGVNGEGVYRSTDAGENWSLVNNGLMNYNIKCFAMLPKIPEGIYLFAGTSTNLYRTTNNGDTWTLNSNGLTDKNIKSFAVYDSLIFSGTNNGGVFYSSDAGISWNAINDGLGNYQIYSLTFSGINLLAGTKGNSVWRRPMDDIITNITSGTRNRLNDFNLEQSYPNPFNPATNIEYRIPDAEFVSLKVYDVLGNEAAVLVNEKKPGGTYTIKFDGSSLSSGVYFYQLKAGSFISTKKMILLR